MSTEKNKQIVRDFFDTLSRADIQEIVNAYTPDGFCWTAGSLPISGTSTRDQVAAAASAVLDLFPEGLKFTLKQMTAEDDRVAVEAESHGVHRSGKVYSNQYHFLVRIRDGKIAEWKEYMDTAHAGEVLCAE